MDKRAEESQAPKTLSLVGDSGNDARWLADVSRAAQHLTRLTLESSAQAALITKGEELWASAGQLPQSVTRELADTVSRYWDRQQENDLVRFVRLSSTDAEYMLYATRLAQDMVLALIFDSETPFSTIRTDASQLVHSLSTSVAEKQNSQAQSALAAKAPPAGRTVNQTDNGRVDSYSSVEQAASGKPTGSPAGDAKATDVSPAASLLKNRESGNIDLGATRPNSIPDTAARKIVLESTSPSLYNLDYACLLVPRFTSHHLIGDLAELLSEWVPQICIAFSWRLEHISVRPDYLLWVVNVSPATSPNYLMKTLRRHTSEYIFNDFPRFSKENPSGDFWAPGDLIMGGSQPPAAELIKDFIVQTRQRQGIPL